jgi:hypothetical protein
MQRIADWQLARHQSFPEIVTRLTFDAGSGKPQ